MTERTVTVAEMLRTYREAWNALPEIYRESDRCLDFFLDVNGNLCALHDSGEEFLFVTRSKSWALISTERRG